MKIMFKIIDVENIEKRNKFSNIKNIDLLKEDIKTIRTVAMLIDIKLLWGDKTHAYQNGLPQS